MNIRIRLTGLSILIGALFAMPVVATAAVVPPDTVTTLQQEVTTSTIAQSQSEKSEDKNKINQLGHDSHEHENRMKPKKEKGQCKGMMDKMMNKKKHDHGDKDNHHSYVHNVAMQAEALGLSDEQLGKIVRLHLKEDRKAHGLLKQNMKDSMMAFRKAVTQPAVDEATLRKLGQEHVDSFNAMIEHHVEERKAILSILTPEQVEKLKEIKVEKKGHEH